MILQSAEKIHPERIRKEFFPEFGPDKLEIKSLAQDELFSALTPDKQHFVLQFADEGRNVSMPTGLETRLGLKLGENRYISGQ